MGALVRGQRDDDPPHGRDELRPADLIGRVRGRPLGATWSRTCCAGVAGLTANEALSACSVSTGAGRPVAAIPRTVKLVAVGAGQALSMGQ